MNKQQIEEGIIKGIKSLMAGSVKNEIKYAVKDLQKTYRGARPSNEKLAVGFCDFIKQYF